MAGETDTLSVLGALRRSFAFLQAESGNEVAITYPNATTEVYTYKNGATTFMALTIAYTDDTKELISSAKRTT